MKPADDSSPSDASQFRPVTFPSDLAGLAMPWETLEAVICGVSAIDLTSIPLASRKDADRFLTSYGYDYGHPDDRAEVSALFTEAVQFINERFLKNSPQWEEKGEPASPAPSVPRMISQSSDALDLMVMAARRDAEGFWACAILKVMHTLSHIENGPYYRQFLEARQQILQRFEQTLTKDEAGYYALPDAQNAKLLSLYGFEAKSQKTRESTLVKLLCKKGNVAENVTDWVGVRFITHAPADAVRVLRILLERQIILFPNIIPSRSRNTLLDFAAFRDQYEATREAIERGGARLEDIEALFQRLDAPDADPAPAADARASFRAHNPASSDEYRSLQITCRQLIRIRKPGVSHAAPPQETRFFIPYEIQILDRQSYFESRHGASAHQLYKRNQIATARRRVLGPLLAAPESPP